VNIFFRINFGNSIGLGNLVRCDRLAHEFKNFGHKCYFIFDTLNQSKLSKFQSFHLYKNQKNINQFSDAKLVLKLLNKYNSKIIILDDQRFNYDWQKIISKKKVKVISFSEGNNKKQYSDFIINYNPLNFPEVKKEYYVSDKKNCNYLIHPKFCIISRQKPIKNYNFKKKFYFTFYIGGGGNLSVLKKILYSVTRNKKLKDCKFLVIIGIFAKNKEIIKNLCKKNKSIEFFESNQSINFIIKNSDFFVGSAGTTLFETAYFKTPSMMFKLAPNQLSDPESLENIGQYFYHDVKELKETKKIVNFLISVRNNYSRIKKMLNNPLLKVDNLGSRRIINKILNIKKNKKNITDCKKKNFSNSFSIRKVQDKDINHYLHSRNLDINRKNSSCFNLIKKLDHYNWWFNSIRKSYLLKRGKNKILYFYEEKLFSINEKDFVLSGWFACTKNCQVRDILYALKWQRKEKKNVNWISFIKNNNVLSLKMSKYLGWNKLNDSNLMVRMVKNKFNLKNKKFTYFYR
jgi:spore coat polysaccharide biosynthesis predicted glycosyltransferase SpsG